MPTTYNAFMVSMVPLLEGGADPSRRSSQFQQWHGELHLQTDVVVEGITSVILRVTVNHYYPHDAEFPMSGALALCAGRFYMEMNGEVPRMEVQAMQLNT